MGILHQNGENDEIGLKSARNTGIKVAQTVLRLAK